MTAQTGPTGSADSTPAATERYQASEAHVAVYAAAAEVATALGVLIGEPIHYRGECSLVVDPARIHDLLVALRDDPRTQMNRLSDLTGVDYLGLGIEPRFAVVYHLMSRKNLARLRLRAPVPDDEPAIDSVVEIFPSANWPEREVFDLLGISFHGHPNLTRILLPDDWTGHPLRKDYPIGAEEVEFSFNPEVMEAEQPASASDREDRYRPQRPVNNF